MKYYPILLLLIFCAFSCNKMPPDDPVPPTEITCTLDLGVFKCQNATCQVVAPWGDVSVVLYPSEVDAELEINPIRTRTTDDEGKIIFTGLDCAFVYVRIDLGERGSYIELFTLSISSTINFEQIFIVDKLLYDDNAVGTLPQAHISFANPVLLQTSNYSRFEFLFQFDATYNVTEYTDNMLQVKLIEQLDENTFVVEESIDRIEGVIENSFSYPDQTILQNEWTFYEDSIRIVPHGESIGSFIWNININMASTELSGITFSLIRPDSPVVDMSIDLVNSVQVVISAVEDYRLFTNYLFEGLILNSRSEQASDGSLKHLIYSKTDGVVRSMDFFNGGSPTLAHGFDLDLE